MFVPKILHGRKVRPAPLRGAASVGSPFIANNEAKSIAVLLESDSTLAQYRSSFAAAQLDDAWLAAEMSLADLRELLPQAPIVDCLKLKRLLSEHTSADLKAQMPDSLPWQSVGRLIANGVRDDNLKEVATIRHEFDLIGSSLFLSFSIGPLLEPPEACAMGRPCPNLLAADLLVWTCIVSCLLAAVVFTWTGAVLESFVSRKSFPRWLQDHYRWFCSPSMLFISGLTCLPPAFGLRLIILVDGHPAYPPWLSWVILGALTGAMTLEWMYYGAIVSHTLGMTQREFWIGGGYLGQIGFLLSEKHLCERPLKDDVAYFE